MDEVEVSLGKLAYFSKYYAKPPTASIQQFGFIVE